MKKVNEIQLDKLPQMEVGKRIPKLLHLISDTNLDAVVVTNLVNIRYLTGFSGSAGILAVLKNGEVAIYTDGRYGIQVEQELKAANVAAEIIVASPKIQLKKLTKFVRNSKKIGIEGQKIAYDTAARFALIFEGSDIVPSGNLIEKLRTVKDEGEIARIEAACNVADKALEMASSLFRPGISELDFATELDYNIRLMGASANSFESIVASGPNGALPHAKPTARKFVQGDLVVCDFGAIVDGYCSDMTRTVAIGKPSSELLKIYNIVKEAQELGANAVKSRVSTTKVDRACRDYIGQKGYKEYFTHSTGHGVGLDIHELPWVASSFSTKLVENMIVTVEPGIYLEGLGGVRIEDTLVVTASGGKILTKATKELMI